MNQLINKIKNNKIIVICLFISAFVIFITQNCVNAYNAQKQTGMQGNAIVPNMEISEETLKTYNTSYKIQSNYNSRIMLNSNARATKKSIKYLAVFVKFSDSDTKVMHHLDDDECVANAEKIFNSEYFEMDTVKGKISVPSFKKYYEMQSYGNLSIETEIFPKENGKVITYSDKHPIGYYLEYSDQNQIGYKDETELLSRETELVNNAVAYIENQVASESITASELDSENDGIVDAISFFIEGNEIIGWGDLLWSHMRNNEAVTATILGKKVQLYNIIYTYDYTKEVGVFSLNVGTYGTIIHEFGHILGFLDLYRFYPAKGEPVGFYDIMGTTIGSNPQNFLTYFISEYYNETNWHAKLPVINKTTNSITLNKPEFIDPNEKRAVKVQVDEGDREYFIIEYHEKQITYDASSADESGIIVYRVNENNKFSGNRDPGEHGEKEHVFIFRPEETGLGNGKGNLSEATLNSTRSKLGKSLEEVKEGFNNQTIYYSDGSNSGIIIEVTNQTENTVTFDVKFPEFNGDGTENNPYIIDSVDSYLNLLQRNTKNKYYKLVADLDFKDVKNYPEIDFKGILDGNNKTISNINAEKTGVFKNVGEYDAHAIISNLNVENIHSKGNGDYLGGFACVIQNSTLKNISLKFGSLNNVASTINSISSTGGFAGNVDSNTIIENCSSAVNITSEKNVGGFIGLNQNATIKDCYANGTTSATSNCGGFIAVQYINDPVYKIPQNVYYNYDKSSIEKSIGGYISANHTEEELKQGIVALSITQQLTIKQKQKMTYDVKATPQKTIEFSISSSDTNIARCINKEVEGIKEGNATIYVDIVVGTQIMRLESQLKVAGVMDPSTIQITEQEALESFGLSKKEGYIVGFVAETNINSIRTLLSSNPKVTLVSIKSSNEQEVTSGIIATNMRIILRFNETEYTYTVVIKGDVNGDGRIFATDYVRIRKHIMEVPNLQGAYLMAADVNNDNLVYATDYVRIRNYIMGSGTIQQTWNKI